MILYKCDPNKNKTCAKTSCQDVCFLTRNKDYACCNSDGDPITEYRDDDELTGLVNRSEKITGEIQYDF